MSVKEHLREAIAAYAREAKHSPDSRGLLERLEALEQEVGQAPDPEPTGEGLWNRQSGVGEEAVTPGQRAAGITINVGAGASPGQRVAEKHGA